MTRVDVLVVGGGVGGCAAAMALAAAGRSVILTEETAWVGGQFTSQAVPADEHPWIEEFGCTARYREFRRRIRAIYSQRPLRPEHAANPTLNPGGGWVSRLCCEPRVALEALEGMLQPEVDAGLVDLRLRTVATTAELAVDRVTWVELTNLETGETERVSAAFVLDATETGEIMPLIGGEYVVGAESKQETGEPHAVDGPARPDAVQALTWVALLGYDEGGDHTIKKPRDYEFWRAYRPPFWPGPLIADVFPNVRTCEPTHFPLFGADPADEWCLFRYRQIINPDIYVPGQEPEPATCMNWPQNDYMEPVPWDRGPERDAALQRAKDLTLSMLYWLQTEAGYPGLRLRPDLTGSEDGFALAPYIREARRIRALTTVREQDVSAACHPGAARAPAVSDSVGIGAYRIDLHPRTGGLPTVDISALPFQIPLGSLIPVRIKNVLAAGKALGVTHVANGCFRLHPVEWNIGESAGVLADCCLALGIEPSKLLGDRRGIRYLQASLAGKGIELDWPEGVGPL